MPDDVELLQQLIMHGGEQAFSLVPAALKKIIIEKQWCQKVDKTGKPFASFEAFVTHRLWQGLESSIDDLRVYCRKHPEVLRLVLAEMEPGRESRGSTKEERENRSDIVTPTERGNSATYLLKRLKRDRPDLFEQVLGGELSVNAAALEAGFRKKLAPIEHALKLLPKLTRAQLLNLRAQIDEALDANPGKGKYAA